MKTTNNVYIKEIKAQIRVINEALKRIQEAEKNKKENRARLQILPELRL